MPDQAVVWKLGFGALVLAISLLSFVYRARTPPETVLEPVVVAPRLPAARTAAVPAEASLGPNESLADAADAAPAPRIARAQVARPEAIKADIARANVARARPRPPLPLVARAASRPKPVPRTSVVAVRAPRGPGARTAARPKPVAQRSPYVAGRQHYPFDPRHRWASNEPPA